MPPDADVLSRPTRPERGRPRDRKADESILAAARALLAESGFEAMSFEAIAQRAGVTRPTIYRRWPTKAHLANAIANSGGRSVADIAQAPGIRAQIRRLVEQLLAQYRRPEMRAANAGLIVSYQRAPELREELHTPLESQARAELAEVIARAKREGTVRPSADADTLFDLAVGAILFRTLFSTLPVSPDMLDAICATLLDGIATDEGRIQHGGA